MRSADEEPRRCNMQRLIFLETPMPQHRTPSEKSEYYVPKETFLMIIHYCKQYPAWVDELNALTDTSRAITYDSDRVQTSNDSDPTSDLAIRRAEISRKKEEVEQVAKEVAGDLHKWLILGVCHDYPYQQLEACGIPCGKNMYYHLRRKFYFELSKKI